MIRHPSGHSSRENKSPCLERSRHNSQCRPGAQGAIVHASHHPGRSRSRVAFPVTPAEHRRILQQRPDRASVSGWRDETSHP